MLTVHQALVLPGIDDDTVWQVRHRADVAAVALANRHYSREARGSRQVAPPAPHLVLVTPCERAVWITVRHKPEATSARALADGLDAWRCSMFRNEGAGLSSALIREAMALTLRLWGDDLPPDEWTTYVEPGKVGSTNPGYCFKRAGWVLDRGFVHPRLVRLNAPIEVPC